MRVQIFPTGFNIWLSAGDTYDWAHKPGGAWPCSTFNDRRVFAQFDTNGLCDLTVNGRDAPDDIDGNEFSVMVADFLRDKLHTNHPCYFVAVGQFD